MTDGASWRQPTYNGFSGAPGQPRLYEPHEYERTYRRRRRIPSLLVILGVAAAVSGGLLAGYVGKPALVRSASTSTAPAVQAPAPQRQVPIEIAVPPAPPPAPALSPRPAPGERLEVLPRQMASAAEPVPIAVPRIEVERISPPVAKAAASPPPVIALAPATPKPLMRPSFDCSGALTPSERMVCEDPALARADRRLAAAYDRAVAAGVPEPALRAEQDDWRAIREDAARRSPDAVASIYAQRIDELEALAGGFSPASP